MSEFFLCLLSNVVYVPAIRIGLTEKMVHKNCYV